MKSKGFRIDKHGCLQLDKRFKEHVYYDRITDVATEIPKIPMKLDMPILEAQIKKEMKMKEKMSNSPQFFLEHFKDFTQIQITLLDPKDVLILNECEDLIRAFQYLGVEGLTPQMDESLMEWGIIFYEKFAFRFFLKKI